MKQSRFATASAPQVVVVTKDGVPTAGEVRLIKASQTWRRAGDPTPEVWAHREEHLRIVQTTAAPKATFQTPGSRAVSILLLALEPQLAITHPNAAV